MTPHASMARIAKARLMVGSATIARGSYGVKVRAAARTQTRPRNGIGAVGEAASKIARGHAAAPKRYENSTLVTALALARETPVSRSRTTPTVPSFVKERVSPIVVDALQSRGHQLVRP